MSDITLQKYKKEVSVQNKFKFILEQDYFRKGHKKQFVGISDQLHQNLPFHHLPVTQHTQGNPDWRCRIPYCIEFDTIKIRDVAPSILFVNKDSTKWEINKKYFQNDSLKD